jgi:hypothetical protein
VTDSDGALLVYSIASMYEENRINAILSIFRTIFVCILMASSAIIFTKDVSDIVITPIENMMEKVHKISVNPLLAA